MSNLFSIQRAGNGGDYSLGNPCVISGARPYLAPRRLQQPGPEVANSLDDLCAICVARASPRLSQTGLEVADSPNDSVLSV